MDGDLATGDAGQDLAQRVEVEDVRQALAVGLDEDREAAVAAGDGQQVGGALALLPERRPRSGSTSRQEQGPGRVLAEPAGEQRGVRDLRHDQVLDLVGVGEEQRLDALEAGVALRQADGDPVVRPDRRDLHAETLVEPALERHRPRGVDAPAERRQQGQPPVAELVAEAFDHDALVRRQGARDLALVLEVGEQVLGRPFVEVVVLAQALRGGGPALGPAREVRLQLAGERAERPTELDGPPDGVALPERELARDAGRRG